jgi:hypothetical protein
MRFVYSVEKDVSLFTAIPENQDELNGFRAQGPYTPLKLVDTTLRIGYVSNKPLHPDIIAAICVTAFYPFIKTSVAFPTHVSAHFASSLSGNVLPAFSLIDGSYKPTNDIHVRGVDPTLESYRGGDKTVCIYGGGCDSTAIALMFPEFPLIHMVRDKTVSRVKDFVNRNLKNPYHEVTVNCWDLTKPGGFTGWTNIVLGALIMAADLEIRHVTFGSILESSTLYGGLKYCPALKNWPLFYEHIGLTFFSVVGGVSELLTAKVLVEVGLAEKPLFCEANNGGACIRCIKCMRKLLEYEYWGGPQVSTEVWHLLDRPEIYKSLSSRKAPHLNILFELFKHCKSIPPLFKSTLENLTESDTSIFRKVYPLSFTAFPKEIRDMLVSRITTHFEVMNDEEIAALERWELNSAV